jgi:Protein of unknown function DUF262
MTNNIGSSSRRIGDLIDEASAKRLTIRPFFQRRLVWNNDDKEKFIDTILKGYPFPEVFVAEGKRAGASTRREKVLVDGQQRLSTLLSYFEGTNDLLYKSIPRFADLTEDQRDDFLDYSVCVRDLGTASDDVIKEIFSRINSTDYALKSMEVLNAMFSGAYKSFCEQLSRDDFFERHKVFPKGYRKRMYDITFCVILVTTLLSGYYKRDDRNEEYLELYNEEFPQTDAIRVALDRVFDFVERCGFGPKSRAWKQTDLFTLLVEVHTALLNEKLVLDPPTVGSRLQGFYDRVGELYAGKKLPAESEVPEGAQTVFAYLKAATKATNDKYSRVDRACIIADLIRSTVKTTANGNDRAPQDKTIEDPAEAPVEKTARRPRQPRNK